VRRRRERGHGEDECVDVSNGRLKLAKKGGVGREQEGGSDLAFEDRIKLGGALLSTISMLAMRESALREASTGGERARERRERARERAERARRRRTFFRSWVVSRDEEKRGREGAFFRSNEVFVSHLPSHSLVDFSADMSTSPSRFLLTPPRLTPSPRRSLFETPAKPHRASLGGKSTTTKALLLLVAVASASFLAGTSLRHHYVAPLKTLPSATSLLPIPIPGWGDEAGGDGSEVFFHIGKRDRG
jgi:hypothetical protein